MAMKSTWEYKLVPIVMNRPVLDSDLIGGRAEPREIPVGDIEAILNECGTEGWELVGFSPSMSFVFKRVKWIKETP